MKQVLSWYRQPGLYSHELESVVSKINACLSGDCLASVDSEICYYVGFAGKGVSEKEQDILKWVLTIPFEEEKLVTTSKLKENFKTLLVEIGPRLNFSTALSTNSVAICQSFGFSNIERIEFSIRYLLNFKDGFIPSTEEEEKIVKSLHDQMTQCRYQTPLSSFDLTVNPEPVFEVDILGGGRKALESANLSLGLAFDAWDIDYYTNLFQNVIKRNPTSVECFDLAQSNSEHSRHWFFKGLFNVDGVEYPNSLFSMIMDTQNTSNNNNVIKFNDNSSAIKGFPVSYIKAESATGPGRLSVTDPEMKHIIFTAETHNFPTGVAPFPGATTGTGGRIRDVQCTGRGAHVVAATAGYCFGNLNIPGYNLPWEDENAHYPENFALPVDIAVEASNGASDYGNKFGEPVLAGFSRSCGIVTGSNERREYIKPIMFSGGLGSLDASHVQKAAAEKGMEIVKLGGPVYRIGVGGGAASSVQVQGDNKAELDFSAVQRGDAEMEQKLNRVIRACVELGPNNPIQSIHDQGAGGNGNVLKEIVEPAGGVIYAENFQLGDPTISLMELWGAEYQESNAALVHQRDLPLITAIGDRERCTVSHVGSVTNSGKIELVDFGSCENDSKIKPVDLELEHVLGSMPKKTFDMKRIEPVLHPLKLPECLSVQEALSRVLRLPSVASKRYLTNKVDRSVSGLVAQQQCVGPLHTPLADVAVVALSHFDTIGAATSIGEQPIKGLLDPRAGARMSVAEALTNLVFADITNIRDVKCSGNWMWPAKLEGEGANLLDACVSMCDMMKSLGIAIDGGKDSLSMAARVDNQVVKAPGTLVVSTYVGCPNIMKTVTPDLKCPDKKGILLHIRMGNACMNNRKRIGGSALAQCFKQLGDEVPDVEPRPFGKCFQVIQDLVKDEKLTAGHDVSDGGLITCLLEMTFAGNCGLSIQIPSVNADGDAQCSDDSLKILFAEEAGVVVEVSQMDLQSVLEKLKANNIVPNIIGYSMSSEDPTKARISVKVNDVVLDANMCELRDIYEETSFMLEKKQSNPHCVESEKSTLKYRRAPAYRVDFDPDVKLTLDLALAEPPKIAIIREEGSNGDREMAAAFSLAGFEVWDVNMQDFIGQKISLVPFRGIAFVGGFSYADVCGSAKGWAATVKFNKYIQAEFSTFRRRPNTFSLGVCNGCQLMALLGWVAPSNQDKSDEPTQGVLLDHNTSGRYESRFATVRVEASPSIMLRGMEGTTWGMWVSHGEGRMLFKSPELQCSIESSKLAPVRYVDDSGQPTEVYPLNPNGSPNGIAALCSSDGRHLAIMPHPERCIRTWQCAWIPPEFGSGTNRKKFSPWMRMFQNSYSWCTTSIS